MPTKPRYGGSTANTITSIVALDALSCATVNQFVAIVESTAPYDVRWCAIGDPTDWPTPATDDARAKQAGTETLPNEFGVITAIAGNDFYGYVFQERAITKMTYVGGDIVFGFDTFEVGRGCWQFNRRVQVDDAIFYESEFGYHKLENDQIEDIGLGVVDDTYPPQVTQIGTYNISEQQNVVYNKAINTVFFESQSLAYNYKTGQWTRLPAMSGLKFLSIDSEAGIIAAAGTLTTSGVGVFDQSGGTAQTATIETKSADLNQGGRTLINQVRPHINGGTTAVRVGVQDALSDSVTYSTGTALNSRSGASNFRSADNPPEGKFVRTEYVITGGFTTALGADIEFSSSGGNQ